MSTDLANINVLPSYFQVSSLTDAVISGIPSGTAHPRISTRGGRFHVIEDGAEETLDTLAIHVVIVGANPTVSKEYYSKSYDEDDVGAPDCFSNNGVTPDISVANPVSANCATCPNNAWGSKITPSGKQAKACTDKKRLAIVSADDITGTVYELAVAPMSLRNLNTYVVELKRRNIPIEGVITKISFDTKASYPCLQFSFAGLLSEADYKAAKKMSESAVVKEVTRVVAISAPSSTPALEAPAAPPALQNAAKQPPVATVQAQQAAVAQAHQTVVSGRFGGAPQARQATQPPQAVAGPLSGAQAAAKLEPPQPAQQGLRRRGRPPKNAQQQVAATVQQVAPQETVIESEDTSEENATFEEAAAFDAEAFEAELRRQLGEV